MPTLVQHHLLEWRFEASDTGQEEYLSSMAIRKFQQPHPRIGVVPTAVLVTIIAMTSVGAETRRDPYARCDEIDTSAARLACFDEIRDRLREPVATPEPVVEPAREPMPTPQTELGPVVTESLPAPRSNAVEESQQDTSPRIQPAPQPRPVAAPSPPSTASDADAANFGLKGIGAKEIKSRVHRITSDVFKERTFYLENGQVWREAWHSRTKVKEGADVVVARSFTGAYRLKVGKYSVRVKRIE